MRSPLLKALETRVLLAQGPVQPLLLSEGLEPTTPAELWNAERPERVVEVHRSYAQAGADILLTNTFTANRFLLEPHGLKDRVAELNQAGARLAREAAGEERYVLGVIGPFGDFLAPLGEVSYEELLAAFELQAKSLVEGGVDGFLIVSMSAVAELECAVAAVRKVSDTLPVVVSMAYDAMPNGFWTMMGVSAEKGLEAMLGCGADVIGCDCGTGLDMIDYQEIVGFYRSLTPKPLFAAPNVAEIEPGEEDEEEDEQIEEVSPEELAEGAAALAKAGANIIGGCQGMTPELLAAFRKKMGL